MNISTKTLLLLPILVALPFAPSLPLDKQIVFAADNPTSSLTNVVLPRGPVALNGDASPFTKVLQDLAAIEAINLKPTEDEGEVWVWEGQWGGETRGAITQTAVHTAMKAGGYTLRELDGNDTATVNIFNSFDPADENSVFQPDLTRNTRFFVATSDARHSALVGFWLGGKNKQALALLPVEYKAKPKPKPLPSVGANAVLVRNFNDIMASLPKKAMPKFPPLARKPRMVRGWLKDMAGNPIANAEVSVYSSIGGGVRTTHKARSNAQGLYQVMVPTGICQVAQVDTDVTYNGHKFNLTLEPVSGHTKQFNSAQGHVEHYVLNTTGAGGGVIRALDGHVEGIIEITLTPVGKLMDGSTLPSLLFRYKTTAIGQEMYLKGLPLGRYKLTARLLDDGEAMPLRVRYTSGDLEYKDAIQVNFSSGYSYSGADFNNTHMNVAAFEVAIGP